MPLAINSISSLSTSLDYEEQSLGMVCVYAVIGKSQPIPSIGPPKVNSIRPFSAFSPERCI